AVAGPGARPCGRGPRQRRRRLPAGGAERRRLGGHRDRRRGHSLRSADRDRSVILREPAEVVAVGASMLSRASQRKRRRSSRGSGWLPLLALGAVGAGACSQTHIVLILVDAG